MHLFFQQQHRRRCSSRRIGRLILALLLVYNASQYVAFAAAAAAFTYCHDDVRLSRCQRRRVQEYHHHGLFQPPAAAIRQKQQQQQRSTCSSSTSTTALNMFMGSDGGILGIGGPELLTILLVGYFILGPSDLYKVVKEIGKFVQNIRSFSTDLTTTFENNMEDQLQLNEIRKAQRELTDAFSFRRTINVDQDEEAFTTTVTSPRADDPMMMMMMTNTNTMAAAGEGTVAAADGSLLSTTTGKKKIRRRVRKAVEPAETTTSVPDTLEMPSDESEMMLMMGQGITTTTMEAEALDGAESPPLMSSDNTATKDEPEISPEEQAIIDREFDQYTLTEPSWYNDDNGDTIAADLGGTSRFQEQLNGSWNDRILANQDKLEPLAVVMQKIALLQEEKAAAEARLQEEFQRREQLEQDYYEKQKELLEEAVVQIQSQAYAGTMVSTGTRSGSSEE